MLYVPIANWAVVKAATRFLIVSGGPSVFLPEKNWTVPVGSMAPLGRTIASNSAVVFGKTPVGVKRMIEVGPFATAMLIGPAELAEKLESPE